MPNNKDDPGSKWVNDNLDSIRRLVIWWGRSICDDRRWEVDDLISDVIEALLKKQRSEASRYDPTRSTLAGYIIAVTKGIVANLLQKEMAMKRDRRYRSRVTVDDLDNPDSDWGGYHPDYGDQVPLDEQGLDDEQEEVLGDILADARRVLRREDDTAYQALLKWLQEDREVDGLMEAMGSSERDVWRYLALLLARLENESALKWRSTWAKHRHYCRRKVAAQAGRGGTYRANGRAEGDPPGG